MKKYRYFVPREKCGWDDFKLYQCSLLEIFGKIFHKNGMVLPAIWSIKEMENCVGLKQWEETTMAEAVLLM